MVQVFQNFQAFDNNVIVDFEVAHLKLWVVFLTRIKNIIFFFINFPLYVMFVKYWLQLERIIYLF